MINRAGTAGATNANRPLTATPTGGARMAHASLAPRHSAVYRGPALDTKLTARALLDETRRLIALRAEVRACEARVLALRDALHDPAVPVE